MWFLFIYKKHLVQTTPVDPMRSAFFILSSNHQPCSVCSMYFIYASKQGFSICKEQPRMWMVRSFFDDLYVDGRVSLEQMNHRSMHSSRRHRRLGKLNVDVSHFFELILCIILKKWIMGLIYDNHNHSMIREDIWHYKKTVY